LRTTGRLNLTALEKTLRCLQQDFDRINHSLSSRRDPLDDRVIENMMAGYAFVDTLIGDGIDLFALGSSKHLLELNTLVLCGTNQARRDASPITSPPRRIASTTSSAAGSRTSSSGMPSMSTSLPGAGLPAPTSAS
jgi:hypothetical protein